MGVGFLPLLQLIHPSTATESGTATMNQHRTSTVGDTRALKYQFRDQNSDPALQTQTQLPVAGGSL